MITLTETEFRLKYKKTPQNNTLQNYKKEFT